MARDERLERLVRGHLGALPELVETTMFGGRAWLLGGHLLCCARHDGLLARLGRDGDGWALALPGIEPMWSGGRPMRGWVRATSAMAGDAACRGRLLDVAVRFVRGLPAKPAGTSVGARRS